MSSQVDKTIDRLQAEVVDLRKEVEGLTAIFELGYTRCEEASALWRAEDPETRALVQPDLGNLIQWLTERGNRPTSRPVLQDWVCELPLRHQGVLCAAVRGCDDSVKPRYSGDSGVERHLATYLRYTFMVPADEREVVVAGAFMREDPPHRESWKPSELGHFPLHYVVHLMHGFQVVAYHHPNVTVRGWCYEIYYRMVESLHLVVESKEQMDERLTIDRFEAGTIVS